MTYLLLYLLVFTYTDKHFVECLQQSISKIANLETGGSVENPDNSKKLTLLLWERPDIPFKVDFKSSHLLLSSKNLYHFREQTPCLCKYSSITGTYDSLFKSALYVTSSRKCAIFRFIMRVN